MTSNETGEMPKKYFTVLENNPEVMNALAQKLGLAPTLAFHEVISLDEPDLLATIPRPALGLLVIMPLTAAWRADREAEDANMAWHDDPGSDPVLWFQQTIGDACGSIGLLHCAVNGPARRHIIAGSTLATLRHEARPLRRAERAKLLCDSAAFEKAHHEVAALGSTQAPPSHEAALRHWAGHHFVAYVKGDDGRLWELEGSRKGPLARGVLAEHEDVLSPRALDMGLRRVMRLHGREEGAMSGQALRFSCLVLAPTPAAASPSQGA